MVEPRLQGSGSTALPPGACLIHPNATPFHCPQCSTAKEKRMPLMPPAMHNIREWEKLRESRDQLSEQAAQLEREVAFYSETLESDRFLDAVLNALEARSLPHGRVSDLARWDLKTAIKTALKGLR